MSGIMQALVIGLGAILAIVVVVLAVIFLIVPTFKGIGWLLKQVFTFIGGMIADTLRTVGTILMVLILTPLAIGSIIFGRWSATAHFGRAIQNEFKTASTCVYRILIGHPARLLCLTPLLDGLERRLPEVVAAAPGRDKPRGKAGQFAGYRIVGSLPVGGSGSKLYIAEPEEVKAATFERMGHQGVSKVVIKSFSIHDGSSLPQIIRESRSLDAAKKLGLVLDHDLTPDRFHYVMRYVPGESLTTVTQQLHAESGGNGLDDRRLKQSLGFIADLVRTLDGYHRGGLWHKDVKPDNIIVDGQQAHLVDFGLLSSLRSAMTLTTHGTEYFRDPEMVRMALKGVKVHEVDGAKFDVFAAGAVAFSVIENSFPAHGALSQITRRCPDALRWIVRRAMTDYDKRYASASELLADLEFVRGAVDPFAVRPAELPSMRGGAGAPDFGQPIPPIPNRAGMPGGFGAAPFGSQHAPQAVPVGAPILNDGGPRNRPKIRVTDWWTGKYAVEHEVSQRGAPFAVNPAAVGLAAGAVPAWFNGSPKRYEEWLGFITGPRSADLPQVLGYRVPESEHQRLYELWVAGGPGMNVRKLVHAMRGGGVAIGGIGRVDATSFAPAQPIPIPNVGGFARTPRVPVGQRRPAKEQLQRAQARAKAAQDRAHARMAGRLSARRGRGSANPTGMNAGVGFAAGVAVLIGVGAVVAASRGKLNFGSSGSDRGVIAETGDSVRASAGDLADRMNDGATQVSDAMRSHVSDALKRLGMDEAGVRQPVEPRPDAAARLLESVGGAPASHTGNVLFVSDVVVLGSQPYVRKYIDQMENSSEALRRMGFSVLGDAAHGATLDSAEFARQVELISQARRAVGATPKGTDRMIETVVDFELAAAGIDGVVWIWPDTPNNPTQFHIAVVGPEGAELHATDAGHFDQALVTAVRGAFERHD